MKKRRIISLKHFTYPVAHSIGRSLEDVQEEIYDDSQIEISLLALLKLLEENDESEGAFVEPTEENPDIYRWEDHLLVPNPKLEGISFVIGGLIEKPQPDESKT